MPGADREAQPETVLADAALAAGTAQADAAQAADTDVLSGGGPQGLSWSWELDFETLLAALSEPAPWNRPLPRAGSGSQTGADTAGADTAGIASAGAAGADDGAVVEADAPNPVSAGSADMNVSDAHAVGSGSAGTDPAGTDAATAGPAMAGVADADAAGTGVADADAAGTASAGAGSADADVADADVADSADADLAEFLEAIEAGRTRQVPLAVVAGRVAESVPAGPGLAGWLAASSVGEMEDGALAGVAASFRRLASWAQAGELAAVAQMASRSAAADGKIGVDARGRPARMPDEACAQVSLALTMSQCGASWWTDLAVTLTWRLPGTGDALRSGEIDLSRARLIAEATGPLDDVAARVVEARVLPAAGRQTTGQLRAVLRRAVIAADPEGAERRRQEAERRAKVSLYPDQEGTASLAGYSLPGTRAAAAMARISALARAIRAAGAGGGIDLLRAQVFLGLLLGTLPCIPPAPGSPPDDPGPDDTGPDDTGSGGPGSDGLRSGGRSSGGRGSDGPRSGGCPGSPRSDGPRSHGKGSGGQSGSGASNSGNCSGPDGSGPDGRGTSDRGPDGRSPDDDNPGCGRPDSADSGPDRDSGDPGPSDPGPGSDSDCGDGDDLGQPDGYLPGSGGEDEIWPGSRPAPAWPDATTFLPPGPAAMGSLRPGSGGLLDLTISWSALTGDSFEPGRLSRIGPITPAQARRLADLAAGDPAAQWRIIVISPDGHAMAVTRIPRATIRAGPAGLAGDDPDALAPAGLVSRVTVTIPRDILSRPPPPGAAPILTRALRAAARAAARACEQAAADARSGNGCAHTQASAAYRPPPRLQEQVTARDITCRFPTCRQPAGRCDLDHTIPYDDPAGQCGQNGQNGQNGQGSRGGRTCSCNLGGLCRTHHQLKQHPRWKLAQPAPGHFEWTTPTGRAYTTGPDSYSI